MNSINQTPWAPLRPILEGKAGLDGKLETPPAWRGLRNLPIGQVLFRGCRAADEAAVLNLVDEPRFWTTDANYGQEYARTYPSKRLATLPGFVIEARVESPGTLADMSLYPLVEKLYFRPALFGISSTSPQEMQRQHSTAIAEAYAGRTLDGIWDHGGREILLVQSTALLSIIRIQRTFEPSATQSP